MGVDTDRGKWGEGVGGWGYRLRVSLPVTCYLELDADDAD